MNVERIFNRRTFPIKHINHGKITKTKKRSTLIRTHLYVSKSQNKSSATGRRKRSVRENDNRIKSFATNRIGSSVKKENVGMEAMRGWILNLP